ncbi:MAG TPA: 4'-phosphopantetheinyl transferase superfamily protein [Pyrinomonadaceae bacterium]|jgi:4'-phosphopantetheinyl transferase|nr:4'-phosphopantetheinyl transferase superfamily protein [Pyrinomonadaceae bacterium]
MAGLPNYLRLGAKEVHIWRTPLDLTTTIVEGLRQSLSQDELARAGRFHFERDRQHFIVARGCLRTILSRYLKTSAAEIEFIYGVNGKPQLADSCLQAQPLYFNLAHSAGLALYAFTLIGELGVDLELIRTDFTGDDIAKRFFSPGEVACLNAVSAELRHEAFFNCWTRKEAFIKATGSGLSLPLDQFEVTLTPGEPARLLRTTWNEDEASRWSIKSIDAGQRYVAAVAVAAHDWELKSWDVDNTLLEFENNEDSAG